MAKGCCPECFGDRALREDIFPSLNPSRGTCGFCGSTDVSLVDPSELNAYFGMLVAVYEPNADGKSLVEWMKEDWALFPDDKMDIAHAKELLGEILDDGEAVRRRCLPSEVYVSEGLARWETLRDEVMFRNRWFLDGTIDTDRLRELLDLLISPGLPRVWYRARIRPADRGLSIGDMGAPPRHLAGHGRANPAGIPYLYLASSPQTAVAEIRPHTGEHVCVARFSVRELQTVDLRNPRSLVSPFILGDPREIGQLRADLPLLERLGQELTRPVVPGGAAIDYIPSQYLCEFIKKCGFDGVVYRSSVSDGINLALFEPGRATGHEVSLFVVERVSVDVAAADREDPSDGLATVTSGEVGPNTAESVGLPRPAASHDGEGVADGLPPYPQ